MFFRKQRQINTMTAERQELRKYLVDIHNHLSNIANKTSDSDTQMDLLQLCDNLKRNIENVLK